MAAVPAPSSSLPPLKPRVFEAGYRVHRVHADAYPGNGFNPCKGAPTRFAPIHDGTGACVPSLYGGETLDAAIFETLFHDIGAKSAIRSVPLADVMEKRHSVLRFSRDLSLLPLFTPELQTLGLTRAELIATPAAYYAGTARWAEALHRRFPDVDGLVWTSNRCDPDMAFLFFGDRVPPDDLAIVGHRDPTVDESLLEDIMNAGDRAGITVTV